MLRNRVVELTQEADGTWNVVTEQGTVKAEHVVNCGGLWAREVGRMVGVELPVLAMEHMYLLTEPMPEVEAFNKETGREMIGVLDFKGEIYTRQERNGILLGTYEKACKPWSPVNTPWDFGHELLPPDLDRIAPSLEVGFKHFPGIEKAGIKQIINGPFTFAPDGNPLVGPVQGLTNFWCRLRASWPASARAAASGWRCPTGWSTAIRASTSGAWTSPAGANGQRCATPTPRCARTIRAASRSASPTRNCRPRGRRRPRRSTTRWWRRTPSWAIRWGLETPLWFAPKGTEPKDIVSFHRSNDFEHIGNEVRADARTASASPRSPTSPNTRCRDRAPRTSSTG